MVVSKFIPKSTDDSSVDSEERYYNGYPSVRTVKRYQTTNDNNDVYELPSAAAGQQQEARRPAVSSSAPTRSHQQFHNIQNPEYATVHASKAVRDFQNLPGKTLQMNRSSYENTIRSTRSPPPQQQMIVQQAPPPPQQQRMIVQQLPPPPQQQRIIVQRPPPPSPPRESALPLSRKGERQSRGGGCPIWFVGFCLLVVVGGGVGITLYLLNQNQEKEVDGAPSPTPVPRTVTTSSPTIRSSTPIPTMDTAVTSTPFAPSSVPVNTIPPIFLDPNEDVKSYVALNQEMELGQTSKLETESQINKWESVTADFIQEELDGNSNHVQVTLTSQNILSRRRRLETLTTLQILFEVNVRTLDDNSDNELDIASLVQTRFESELDQMDYILQLRLTQESPFEDTSTVVVPTPATPPPITTDGNTPSSSAFFQDGFDTALLELSSEEPESPLYVVELLKYRDQADYEDGFTTTVPGSDTDKLYQNWLLSLQAQNVAVEKLYQADWSLPEYDEVMIWQFASGPASFVQDVLQHPDFAQQVRHRQAGIDRDQSLILATTLLSGEDNGPPMILREDDDTSDSTTSISFVHLLNIQNRASMKDFDVQSAPLKAKHDIHTYAWLSIQSVGIGSSGFDQVRLEYVPSSANWARLMMEDSYTELWAQRSEALEQEVTAMTDYDNGMLPNLYKNNNNDATQSDIDITSPVESGEASLVFFNDGFDQSLLQMEEDEKPLYIVDLLKYREFADYEDGYTTTVHGSATDRLYENWLLSLPNVEKIYQADWDNSQYDEVILWKFDMSPTSFVNDVLYHPDFAEFITHRQASIVSDETTILATTLMEGDNGPPDLLTTTTGDDDSESAVLFVHLLEITNPTLMNEFDSESAPMKAEHGILTYGWLSVQSVAYGSSPPWDQVRLEFVPSFVNWAGLANEANYSEIWAKRQDALEGDTSPSMITRIDDDNSISTFPNLYK